MVRVTVGDVMLPCVVNGRATPDLIAGLSAEKDRIDGQIDELVSARDRLDAAITNATANWRTGRRCRPR